MNFPDLSAELHRHMPDLRGALKSNANLAEITWFRVGGPAQILFLPEDEADLSYFLKNLPDQINVQIIGFGSNLLVRDGGIEGVVIKLGRGFGGIDVLSETEIRAGAGVPDTKLARASALAGISGLSFYRGIPGTVGGALRMNAGAHGRETADTLKQCRAVDRRGDIHDLNLEDLGYSYRHADIDEQFIFTGAVFHGEPDDTQTILNELKDVAEYREAVQPVKSRTGGSTFKNPPSQSAWKLIDAAGCRGMRVGGASVSQLHCNFLINEGNATAEQLEELGESVQKLVRKSSGVDLEWEIKRIGLPANATVETE